MNEDDRPDPKHMSAQASETIPTSDAVGSLFSVQSAAARLSTDEQKTLALGVAQHLSPADRRDLADRLLPDQPTTNRIWTVVVWTFSAIALGTVVVLALITLGLRIQGNATDAKTMLTVFTTVVGFLAGLLAPSPIKGSAR